MLAALLFAGYGVGTAYAAGDYYSKILGGTDSASMSRTDDEWSKLNSNYAHPGYTQKTCGGRELSGEASYFFGFKREYDGLCMTRKFIANDATEAWKCAHDACQTCEVVEDVTEQMAQYNNKPSAFNGQVMLTYCPRE